MAEDVMSVTPLGSGQEVGRSCHLLEFRGMTVLLDCGIHPGHDGMAGLPFLDRIEPEQVDVVLITHFHLDHAASLPYWTERTKFKGRIFMTHPTKAVMRLLLGDYLRLLQMKNAKSDEVLYTEADLQSCMDKVELMDYHTTVTVGGMSFYALNAGHVLGACMYMIELGGRKILYTGDYSMEDDRHLMAAEIPLQKPDLLIVESTYGVQVHASRAEREARFTGTVERVVTRGGRCLIPVFALGRAQELLLILDEYWQANPALQNIPIWYASKLASRALRVYQTYANMMNARIRAQMDVSNPFAFRHISNLKSIDVNSFDDSGPCVVFASPGMLQSGVSRQLFDRWAADTKNGVLIAGYAVEHTLAKEIMSQPKEVVTLEGRRQPLACLVDYVSFSAHVDFVQNRKFITAVSPRHIILVHGGRDEMGRLKKALMFQYEQLPESKRPTITMPPNLQEVKLKFARRRSAKVMGSLAAQREEPAEGDDVSGILVTHNFASKIVAPSDLSTYTPLRVGVIESTLHVPYAGSLATLRLFLQEMFVGVSEQELENDEEEKITGRIKVEDGDDEGGDRVQQSTNDDKERSRIVTRFTLNSSITNARNGCHVNVTVGKRPGVATVEWEASPQGDVIADSVVALIMHAQSCTASIRLTSKPCRHPRAEDDIVNGSNSPSKSSSSGKRMKVEEDEEGNDGGSAEARETTESRLRFIHAILKEQFERVEAVYERNCAKYEIETDAGLESNAAAATAILDDDGVLRCYVTVDFDDDSTGTGIAKIVVESKDEKLATNVRECLRQITAAMQPMQL